MKTKLITITIALLSLTASAQSWKPDKDQQIHFYAGMTISSMAYEFNSYHRAGKQQMLVTIGSAAFAGIAKETYDKYHKGTGFRLSEALYTTAGGVLTYYLAELTGINPGFFGIAGLTGVYFTYNF